MNRRLFLVLGTVILCILPVIGTLFGAAEEPHRTVQLRQAPLTVHY